MLIDGCASTQETATKGPVDPCQSSVARIWPNVEHLRLHTGHVSIPSVDDRIDEADVPMHLQRGAWPADEHPELLKKQPTHRVQYVVRSTESEPRLAEI